MRRLLSTVIVLTIFSVTAAWGSVDGGTESIFNLGAGARAMGMGNGFVALSDDATAIYYNPAGLGYLSSQQVSLLHTVIFEGTIYDFASYAYPLGHWGGFGVAGMRLGTDDIGRRDDIHDLGRFSASQTQLLLSYGRPLAGRFAAGVSVKVVNQSIDDYSAYGFGLDAGGRIDILRGLRGGFMLQDIVGARLKLATVTERTPYTIKAGLAYQLAPHNTPFSGVATFDLDKPEQRGMKIHTGLELRYGAGLALRGGYDRDDFAFGAGIRYQRLDFDYAYKFVDRLTDSHRFSLTFSFGTTEAEKSARKTAAQQESGRQIVNESLQKSLLTELKRADRYYAEGKLDSALAAYYRADAFAQDKEYIYGQIKEIKRRLRVAGEMLPGMTGGEMATGQAVGSAADFERQAAELYRNGALSAARDVVAMARRYHSQSTSLDTLETNINTAIDRVIWANFAEAESALSLADYVAAYDCYNTIMALDVNNKKARDGSKRAEKSLNFAQKLSLALEYFNTGKYISSQREFSAVLELDPGNKTALEFLGRIGDIIKKSTSLDDLQKDSRVWKLYLNGLEAFRQGQYDKAIELWQAVLEVYPNNRNTLENIEQAKLRLQK